jgi:prepilin-type N-terminal cleavage/methylation domain-containing protein
MNSSGVTLVELLVTISIISILVAALAFSYRGWQGRYNIEGQMRQVQSDLTKARTSAIGRQRDFFVVFKCNSTTNECASYSVYEDTNPGPDGNGTLESTGSPADTRLNGYPKTLAYPVTWAGGPIKFDDRGLITPNSGAVVVTSSRNASTTDNPDYDCISFTDLKMNLGQWNVASAACTLK